MPTTHAFNIPNPYQAQLDEIARRQKLAEIMQAQAFQPAESSSYKGVQFTSPASHLAKLLQLGAGIWAADRASEERKEVGEKSASDMAEILKRGDVLERGVPGEAAVPASVIPAYSYKPTAADFADKPDLEVDASGMAINPAQAIPGSPAIPAIPPNLRGAAAEYMKHPALVPMGMATRERALAAEDKAREEAKYTATLVALGIIPPPGQLTAQMPASGGPAPLLPQGAVGGGTGFPNNLGNIRVSPANWEGKGEPYKGFETFDTPQSGANAMFKNLGAYVRQNPNITVAQAIAKWAPPNENDTALYIRQVGEGTGINPGMPLAEVLKDPAVSAQLLDAITRKEKGGLPAGVTADTFMTATGGAPSGAGVVPVGAPSSPASPAVPSAPPGAASIPTPSQPPGAGISDAQITALLTSPDPKLQALAKGMLQLRQHPMPSGGAFSGSGMEAQARNALVRVAKEPAFAGSPEYALAHGFLSQPRQVFDESRGVMITLPPPDLSAFPRPTFSYGGGGQPAPQNPPQQPNVPPSQAAPPVTPADPPVTQAAPKPGVPTITPVPGLSEKRSEAFKKLDTEARTLAEAIDNFEQVIKEQGGGTFRAFINDPQSPSAQKVHGAYQALKIAARGEGFLNTGVLQPGEERMIEKMLLSPESLRGWMASPKAYTAKLNEFRKALDAKMGAAYQAHGLTRPEERFYKGESESDEARKLRLRDNYGIIPRGSR